MRKSFRKASSSIAEGDSGAMMVVSVGSVFLPLKDAIASSSRIFGAAAPFVVVTVSSCVFSRATPPTVSSLAPLTSAPLRCRFRLRSARQSRLGIGSIVRVVCFSTLVLFVASNDEICT